MDLRESEVFAMKCDIYFKNYAKDEKVKDYIEKRVQKLEKYFPRDYQANIVISELRGLTTTEITLHVASTYLRVETTDKDVRTAFDKAIDKMEIQLKKFKNKLQSRLNDSIRYEMEEEIVEEEENKIVRSKKFGVKPMSPEEASLQMELLGHMFFVFLNADTEVINVIYKRKDGQYGLIEPEF